MQEEAVGSVFWHPKGWKLFRIIEDYMRRRLDAAGYQEVKGPQLLDRSLWEATGHWENFRENMFIAESRDERVLAVKPMNCPGHVLIFRNRLRSYRELPLRLAEFGSCHRNEPSGALHGLMRVRAFTQDDAHIFCTEDQVTAEAIVFCQLLLSIYRDFGFDDVAIKFADRPPMRTGSDAIWDRAEKDLRDAVEAAGLAYTLNPGEGAFYGPKLEFVLRDALGRDWQCGTLQLDFNMTERLGRDLCRRGWRPPYAGHAASRDPRLGGTLHRHPDRALRGKFSALAGAGPGRRCLDHRGGGRVCRGGSARTGQCRVAGDRRSRQRKDQLQGARAQPRQGAADPGGRPARG